MWEVGEEEERRYILSCGIVAGGAWTVAGGESGGVKEGVVLEVN